MYALGYCVEKHRCHSCGAHGHGKTLAAQVIPRGMTKTFVKYPQKVFPIKSCKTCLQFHKAQSWHLFEASNIHVLTDTQTVQASLV